jgi:hypothetical protein
MAQSGPSEGYPLRVITWCIIWEPISKGKLSMRRGLSVPNSILAPQSGAIDDWGLFIAYSRWAERDDITGPGRGEWERLDYDGGTGQSHTWSFPFIQSHLKFSFPL